MRDANPQTIYLKDYKAPAFWVDSLSLTFNLDADNTEVLSVIEFRRNAENDPNAPLTLHGEQLELISLSLDDQPLATEHYTLSEQTLVIEQVPDQGTLTIQNRIHPSQNTALEGLFESRGMLCTQCEAEGFRKITWFLDRPDVMTTYQVKLIADKQRYPVLLCNGNRIDSGDLDDGRHWVSWQDPFKKPSYLFALVAGDLDCLKDRFTTMSGREIQLEIYVEAHDLDKCDHAMQSLKKSMRWDEQAFGREYDLDLYMIVAVSHFNMGAMENKGLNVFNTKFVLASEQTATDSDYEHIEGVIGHEYFHNWSGNRVTCRDWFQLSLKEGFTVFRDQQFTADQTSPAVKRIEDVSLLRSQQFAEDAGPLAHPIRPDAYIEINNFYTLTVYEKGAEVVRMLHTLLGADDFRKGCDLYFERHDGQAVTTEDFVAAHETASGRDLSQFKRWYEQAGTPRVKANGEYDAANQTYHLTLQQRTPDTPKQTNKPPLHIPITLGLLGTDGQALPLTLRDETAVDQAPTHRVIELTEAEQTFSFTNINTPPLPSLLRGFSAPVILEYDRTIEQSAFLFKHDSDPFNRWESGQQLASQIIFEAVESLQQKQNLPNTPALLIEAFEQVLHRPSADLSYQSLLLSPPSLDALAQQMDTIHIDALHQARSHIRNTLGRQLSSHWQTQYEQHHHPKDGKDANAIGRRRLKNLALSYLCCEDQTDGINLAIQQFDSAQNMTDQLAALSQISHSNHAERERCLAQFYQQWQHEALVIDKWFTLQATSLRDNTIEAAATLLDHPDFDLQNPNRVRSLLGALANANPVHFHRIDGAGYSLIADHILKLDAINPQIAARLCGSLSRWRRYDNHRQTLMQQELRRVMERPGISPDVYEVASKSLGNSQ